MDLEGLKAEMQNQTATKTGVDMRRFGELKASLSKAIKSKNALEQSRIWCEYCSMFYDSDNEWFVQGIDKDNLPNILPNYNQKKYPELFGGISGGIRGPIINFTDTNEDIELKKMYAEYGINELILSTFFYVCAENIRRTA